MITIIDYGMGNIHSVKKALEINGASVKVTNDPKELALSSKIVLPGVGAFDDAMLELEKRGLISAIKEGVKSGKPFLGICLGMQLLFDKSEEASKCKGLGFIAGEVKKLPGTKQKVPHMGWNQLKDIETDCLLLKGISTDSFVYFCHSYYPEPKEENVCASMTDYGTNFPSAVFKNNVYGVQFHPEKSQKVGLKIMENFLKLC